MGAGASINSLSPEELGQGVAGLGKAYELYNQAVVDEGISGEVLFESVQEDEQLFRAFVTDTLGVNKPHHQTAMYKRYVKLIVAGEGGDEGKSTNMPIFDVRDAVERSPKDILNELFQIQGIPLDPDNVAAAVDKIAAAIIASVGENTDCDGKTLFDAFISYRVWADKDIAEKVYDKLSMKGLFPFLDKYKLQDGMPWKAGFLEGLKGSRCFVSLISRKALESCRDHTRNHTNDNVLLEIETALRYKKATGNNAYIIPVMIGEVIKVDGTDALRKFADFAGGLYADTVEGNGKTFSVSAVSKDSSVATIDATTAEIAAMKAQAEQEAKEIKAKAEREAKEQADRVNASTSEMKAQAEREIAEMKAKAEKERKQQVPAKATVRIAGTTGPAAGVVNGMYEATTEISGDMPVYVKVGHPDRWLEYHAPKSQWQAKSTANKGKGNAAAFCAVPVKCLPEKCPPGQWTLDNGGKFDPQPAITISSEVTQDEVEAYLAEVQREAARVVKGSQHVLIAGATGPTANFVNGVYKPTDELCGNVSVYVKVDNDDWCLEYSAGSKQWQVKPTDAKGKDVGLAFCAVPVKCLPEECPPGQWKVGDGTPQSAITISVVTQGVVEAYLVEVKSEAARVVRGSQHVRIAGATGIIAGRINGVYKPTNELSDNVMVYNKVGDGDMWLVYRASMKHWMVQSIVQKGTDGGVAGCGVSAKCLPEDCPPGMWVVNGGTNLAPHSATTITVLTQKEAEAYLAEVEREATLVVRGSHNVRIAGAAGLRSILINGVYKPTVELCDNATVYAKVDDGDKWLEYNAALKHWQVKPTSAKGTAGALAYCAVPAKCLPEDCPAGKWEVLCGLVSPTFEPQPTVIITKVQ